MEVEKMDLAKLHDDALDYENDIEMDVEMLCEVRMRMYSKRDCRILEEILPALNALVRDIDAYRTWVMKQRDGLKLEAEQVEQLDDVALLSDYHCECGMAIDDGWKCCPGCGRRLVCSNRESGWLVKFNDGRKMIMSEDAYKRFADGRKRDYTVEHWFKLNDAIAKNPGVEILVM